MIFGEYSDIFQTDVLTIQRFRDISRFLFSGSWQVGWWRNTTDENLYEEAVIKIYVNKINSILMTRHYPDLGSDFVP